MKGSSIIALLFLGAATFVGVGVLARKAVPGLLDSGPIPIALLLIMAVVAALFVFGVFLGFLYGKSTSEQKTDPSTLRRFREALGFERQERVRLETELYEAKQRTVGLEDRLHREVAKAKVEAEKFAATALQNDRPPYPKEPEELDKLQTEISELHEGQERLRNDLYKRKERIADLMAELSVAQTEAEEARNQANQLKDSFAPAHPAAADLSVAEGESIKDVLEGIIVLEGVQMALVADDYGLVVETAGTGMSPETLAAISSLIAEIGPRLRDVLPIGEVASVSLGDEDGLVLDTRYFELLGTRCALAIARNELHPYPGLADQAIKSITSRIRE